MPIREHGVFPNRFFFAPGEMHVIELSALLLALPILFLLSLVMVPSSLADKKVGLLRRFVPIALVLQCLLASFFVVGISASGNAALVDAAIEFPIDSGNRFGAYIDGTACLMLLMVSVVGTAVSRFSIRYLDGESMQGRYFRWLGFTAGAVSMMVVVSNLLLFFAAWVMTSFGLHQLLLHYRHRRAAHRAAWTKFTISRIGDAFLIASLILTFKTFGTFDLPTLFQLAKDVAATGNATAGPIAIGWCLVLGAVTKSAQFPFHTWLPNTMETPTPVSALMHAGIVNAGGYLIIRMSHLVALAPEALVALALIGAFTACFGGIVMMTQPSVKRALAYSTIAQMGFMMLQCGLGAFSAAMLHILAHSFYKAHAFLSSGSVIAAHQATSGATRSPPESLNAVVMIAGLLISTTAFILASTSIGFEVIQKPGGMALGFILCMALTTWGWRLFAMNSRKSMLVAVVGISGLSITYLASYLGVNHLVASSVPVVTSTALVRYVSIDIVLAFSLLLLLHLALLKLKSPQWLEAFRIHATNGFYIDAIYARILGSFVK